MFSDGAAILLIISTVIAIGIIALIVAITRWAFRINDLVWNLELIKKETQQTNEILRRMARGEAVD